MPSTDRRREYELENTLETLIFEKVLVINKSRLLQLLGRERDRPEAWEELLEHFAAVGGERDELYASDLSGDRIILATFPLARVSQRWAKQAPLVAREPEVIRQRADYAQAMPALAEVE